MKNDNAIKTVTEAINETNGDWLPDWGAVYENKYNITKAGGNYWVEVCGVRKSPAILPYCKSRAALEIIIDNHIEDLDLIFGEGQ